MKNRTLLINLLQLPFMSFSKCLLLGKAWQVRQKARLSEKKGSTERERVACWKGHVV